MGLKMQENTNMEEHFLRVDELALKLKKTGVKLDGQVVKEHLLLTLPISYSVIISVVFINLTKLFVDKLKAEL